MTLVCESCGSYELSITSQTYTETTAFEQYECDACGATGTLRHDGSNANGATLSGSLTTDWE